MRKPEKGKGTITIKSAGSDYIPQRKEGRTTYCVGTIMKTEKGDLILQTISPNNG